jgi:hypothetical protein
MPLLAHDHPAMRQHEYASPPTQAHPTAIPLAWNEGERSGIDWSFSIARPARLNNRSPSATGIAWDDIRAWNSGYWPGVLISPRHVLVPHHYYAAVPSQRHQMRFLRRDGTSVVPTVAKVHAGLGFDVAVIELAEPVEGVAILDRIADATLMPDRLPVWAQGPQSRSYRVLARVGRFWDDAHGWHAHGLAWEADSADELSANLLDPAQPPAFFSGDSGTPFVAIMPDGKPALLGMAMSFGVLRRVAGPAEQGVSPFDRVRAVVEAAGYDLHSVGWPGPMPPPPPRSPDIDGDGKVDAIDLGHVLAQWGRATAFADLDRSGVVDAADLAIVMGAWTKPPAGGST